jgi:adenine-specific DNA-methyltransferase
MANKQTTKQIEQYEHTDKERANNPHVGLVTPDSDPDTGEKKTYEYDPHLDPQLQWTGKAEHTSFEVPTVSLHVHERIDPNTIIETVKKEHEGPKQMSLFETNEKPLREAIDFYKHKEGWTNRLIAGDSLLVMNSLLEKEGMAGKVQMVYFDPPYGIKFGSNFQPYIQQREVKERDQDLTSEPEMIKAFRDTWELGIHSYLTYIRDRAKLFYELLSDSGCVIFQINAENQHRLCLILDEIFKPENLIANIPFRKKNLPLGGKFVEMMHDHLLIYAKDRESLKYHQLYTQKNPEDSTLHWGNVEYSDGIIEKINPIDFPSLDQKRKPRLFRVVSLLAPSFSENSVFSIEFEGKEYYPPSNGCWIVSKDKLKELIQQKRITTQGNNLVFKMYFDDFPLKKITGMWDDIASSYSKIYSVQTSPQVLERCINLFSDPGDLILDTTCGSGTSAYASEKLGRRWITCDTSRVAIQLTKQRLMTSLFDYFELARPLEGVSSGFNYDYIETISMKAIANNESTSRVILYDKPKVNNSKARITGPFTVEAVPAPYAKSFDDLDNDDTASDTSIARTGETLRQSEWRDELLKSGVRAKGGNIIQFSRVEPLSGTKFIQAEAETKEDTPKKVLVVFGPEHAPLEQRMVENAWQEARALKPDMLLFCAFQFDEEAAKDIDELTPAIAGMQLLKAQMNADMLTDDLRKKRSSNESFWLVGQPDVKVHKLDGGKVQVEVMGFDYYNPKTGNVESGGKKNIAMWMLDTDYDNRSLFPSQVFFPMAGSGDGWDKLAKNLKAEIDEEKIEAFKGTLSLEFEPGNSIAVKIIDDRGIESLRVIKM